MKRSIGTDTCQLSLRSPLLASAHRLRGDHIHSAAAPDWAALVPISDVCGLPAMHFLNRKMIGMTPQPLLYSEGGSPLSLSLFISYIAQTTGSTEGYPYIPITLYLQHRDCPLVCGISIKRQPSNLMQRQVWNTIDLFVTWREAEERTQKLKAKADKRAT